MAFKFIFVASLIMIIIFSTATFSHNSEKKQSEFDKIWGTTMMKQEEFDGMPLPETSEVPTVTQMAPAIVNVDQRYGVPFTLQSLGKKTHKPDNFMDHMMEASFMSGSSLISLGVLAMIVMSSKAILLAFGAILLTCLSSGWLGGLLQSESANTVYKLIANPQVMHRHSYSAEVHHEPYSSSQPSLKDYYGYQR